MPILGTFRIAPDARGIPVDGLLVPSLRVEVQDASSGAWIAELVLRDALPWKRGDEKCVEVRIASPHFRQQVDASRPVLRVTRGADFLGTIEIDPGSREGHAQES